jgi:hypothetical protein
MGFSKRIRGFEVHHEITLNANVSDDDNNNNDDALSRASEGRGSGFLLYTGGEA